MEYIHEGQDSHLSSFWDLTSQKLASLARIIRLLEEN